MSHSKAIRPVRSRRFTPALTLTLLLTGGGGVLRAAHRWRRCAACVLLTGGGGVLRAAHRWRRRAACVLLTGGGGVLCAATLVRRPPALTLPCGSGCAQEIGEGQDIQHNRHRANPASFFRSTRPVRSRRFTLAQSYIGVQTGVRLVPTVSTKSRTQENWSLSSPDKVHGLWGAPASLLAAPYKCIACVSTYVTEWLRKVCATVL
jgi:hypothetical protein